MHDGGVALGVDWGALLFLPLERGMLAVLWLHSLSALFPRREGRLRLSWRGLAVLVLIAFLAAADWLSRAAQGTVYFERALGTHWRALDFFFVLMGAALARRGAGRRKVRAAPRARDARVLLAASLRAAMSVAALAGPSPLVGLVLNIPSQALFYYAFLTSEIEV